MDLSALLWVIAAGGGTTLGAIILIFWRRPSDRAFDLSLGASAGIMLAATVLGLLPAAADAGPYWKVAIGFALGCLVIALGDKYMPHMHARFMEGRKQDDVARFIDSDDGRFSQVERDEGHAHNARLDRLDEGRKRMFLLTGAISLHNFPEGMAVGIAFAGGGSELGIALALAILFHNIPEGLAVGMPMRATGMSIKKTVWWTTVTGLIEIAGALIAYFLGTSVEGLLPWGLAFAAGAMLYVIIDEMIPAAHTRGEQRASLVFLTAFLAMAAIMQIIGSFIAQGVQ